MRAARAERREAAVVAALALTVWTAPAVAAPADAVRCAVAVQLAVRRRAAGARLAVRIGLHAGAAPDPATGARATPIYQTASFVFPDSDHAAALFNMERAGHVYSRISNPTCAVLEERISALEGGVGAIAVASGQAALHLAIATLLGAGSHIVASRSLYGGSHNLLHYTLPRFGIETTFVDPRDVEMLQDLVVAAVHSRFKQPRAEMTRRICRALENPYVNILAHPTGRLIGKREPYNVDLEAVFAAARRHGKALEINSYPERLDLNDVHARRARELEVLLAINTDTHALDQLDSMRLGVATARRAWVEPAEVINTWTLDTLRAWARKPAPAPRRRAAGRSVR